MLVLRRLDNGAIRASLENDGIACPTDVELDLARAEYVPGRNKKDRKARALLEQLDIAEFVPMSTKAEQAVELLRHPRARELVEAGAVIGVPAAAVAQTAHKCLRLEVAPETIAGFWHTFFDVSLFTRAQLRLAVREHVAAGIVGATGADDDSLRRAVDSDARVMATALPAVPASWAATLMALGCAPGRHELADAVGPMMSAAVVRATEALNRGRHGDEIRAKAFVDIIEKLHQIRAAVVTPGQELAKQLTGFKLRHDAAPMKSVHELRAAGAEVTVDIAPLGERAAE